MFSYSFISFIYFIRLFYFILFLFFILFLLFYFFLLLSAVRRLIRLFIRLTRLFILYVYFVLFYFYFFIFLLLSAVRRPPSAIRRPPSAIRRPYPPSGSALYRVPFKNPFSLNFETDSYLICVHLGNEMRGQLVICASVFLVINIFTRTPIW